MRRYGAAGAGGRAFQSCPLADCADNTLYRPRFQRLIRRFAAHKQAGAALAGYHILLHHKPCANGKIHLPILIALAGDAHRAADEVKIGHVKLCDLTQSAATRYEKFNQCLFAVALAGIAQTFQFFDGQRLAGTLLVQFQGLYLCHGILLDFLFDMQPPEKRPQCVDMRLQTGFGKMPVLRKVPDIAADVVGRYLGSALVHPGGKHFEVVLVVLQGPFRQAVNALCTEIILDSPVQIATLLVAVFDDNVVLEDCRHRLGGDWCTARKCCANPLCKLCFCVQRLVPLSIFDV